MWFKHLKDRLDDKTQNFIVLQVSKVFGPFTVYILRSFVGLQKNCKK